MFEIFPATQAQSLQVLLEEQVAADAQFSTPPHGTCALRSTNPDFDLVACGALYVVKWETHVENIPPQSIDITYVDVVSKAAGAAIPVGFYRMSLGTSDSGLTITFGFRPPTSSRVRVSMSQIESHGVGGTPRNQVFKPPLTEILEFARVS